MRQRQRVGALLSSRSLAYLCLRLKERGRLLGRPIPAVRAAAAILLAVIAGPASGADFPPPNTPAEAGHYPGKFIWGDLFTADPEAAKAFYTGMFGWTATTVDRTSASGVHPYVILSVDGRPVAGIARSPKWMKDEVHGMWVGYISVEDVAGALAAATAGGGHVISGPKDLPQRGSQGLFSDPDGAVLGVMHSNSGDPGEYLPEPGDWTWSELFARNLNAACLF
jgi:predicted enzyme related to lactoylglutathione lyase